MNCQSAQDWLLHAEDLRPRSWPKDLVAHVKSCSACVKVVNMLSKLEKAWHEQPIAIECEQAKGRFLSTVGAPAPARSKLRQLLFRVPRVRFVAAAAMILIAFTAFGWLVFSPGQTRASSDVVDRLLEWNLEMTNATPQDRKRLLEEHETALRLDLQKAQPKLAPEERELADNLLAHGVWLAANDDVIEEADRVNNLAEELAGRVETAGKKNSPKESEHAQLHYYKFMQRGVHPVEVRITQMKPPEKKEEWKKGPKMPPWMNPAQFQQKQQELRKSFDALRKKGSGFKGFGGFGVNIKR